jgi:hypothetical protein
MGEQRVSMIRGSQPLDRGRKRPRRAFSTASGLLGNPVADSNHSQKSAPLG